MSEASRARRQFLINRLEELRAKYGHEDDWPEYEAPEGVDCDPSWGPVGSLSGANDEPAPVPESQLSRLHWSEAQKQLDQFGETPVYVCELCDEQSAKASVPLDAWHCTACGAWGRPSKWRQRSVLPGTDVQRV